MLTNERTEPKVEGEVGGGGKGIKTKMVPSAPGGGPVDLVPTHRATTAERLPL